MLIRSISGVRGLVASHLGKDVAVEYVRAVDNMLPPGDIVLGRDSRPSGTELIDALQDEFIRLGRNVVNCGIVPTPTVQFITENSPAAGGIIVTASHNPIEWNGLKFVRPDGTFFLPDECKKLFTLVDAGATAEPGGEQGQVQILEAAAQKHIDHILALDCIDVAAIRARKFKVVIDAVNGAGAEAQPLLLKALGCDVYPIYCEPSGEFLRGTEPLPHNLADLGKAVLKSGADVGFAVDPDADRLAVVSEKGQPLGEENTLVLAVDGYWKSTGEVEPIVVNLSTTMALDKLAQNYDTQVLRAAVGEINVVQLMQKLNAPLGGEGNGGVILRDAHLGRDSLVGAAMVLNRLAQNTDPVSAVITSLPQFEMIKDKVSLEGVDVEQALAAVENEFSVAVISKLDGVKFTWDDSWVHLRKSNTEPIMRIMAEAMDQEQARALVKQVKTLI